MTTSQTGAVPATTVPEAYATQPTATSALSAAAPMPAAISDEDRFVARAPGAPDVPRHDGQCDARAEPRPIVRASQHAGEPADLEEDEVGKHAAPHYIRSRPGRDASGRGQRSGIPIRKERTGIHRTI